MDAKLITASSDEYHADRVGCDGPTLSASVASVLLRQSPLHAWLRHPKLGGVAAEPSPEMDRGTILHALVLATALPDGPQTLPVCVVEAENYRTKAAQQQRDAAREAGLVPVLRREWEDFEGLAKGVSAELERAGVRLGGDSEQVVLWQEETPAGAVACRGMMDHVILGTGEGLIYDLKTCRSAHPRAVTSHVMEYGHDVQAAAYTSAVEKVRPELAGRVRFIWIFAEEVGGRVVLTVAEPSGALRELGRRKWDRACETWARCLQTNHWPAYAEGPVTIDAPAWALAEEEVSP